MQVKVGDYKLVYSENIIGIKDYPIIITLPDDIEGDFKFIFNFKKDSENKNSTTKFTTIDNYSLQIDFNNFDGFMGGGNSELIQVGTLRKLPLYINYRIFDLANVGKTLILNFYSREEANYGN